jgi:hypothetical protein
MNIKFLKEKDTLIQISFFLGMFVLMYYWYLPFTQIFPIEDDLKAVRGFSSASLGWLLSTATINYRPVLTVILYFIINLFGYNMIIYYILNLFLNTIIALLICRKISKISDNYYLGFVFSFLYIISNFGLYGIVQIEGIMELLCLFFLFIFLSAIYDLLYGEAEKTFKYLYIALISYLLIIFTHERFIVLILPLIFTSLFKYKQSANKRFLFLSVLSILPLLFNIFIKKVIFKTPFFRGTNGQLITPNISNIFLHIKYHIKYLFGIHNNDDVYLNGIASQDVSGSVNILIYISILSLLLIFLVYFFICTNINKKLFESKKSFYFTFLCLITIGLLIASSSGTIRVEQRWIYAPYMIGLFLTSHVLEISKKASLELLKQNIKIQYNLSSFIKIFLPWVPMIIFLFNKINNGKYFVPAILCFGFFTMFIIVKKERLLVLINKVLYSKFNIFINIILLIYTITTFSYSSYYRNFFNNIFLMEWHARGKNLFEKKYEIGKTIYLGTSYKDYTPENSKYIKSGLSIEEYRTWSNSEVAELTFFLEKENVQNDLIFQANIDIFGETQEAQLFVNNQFVDTITLMKSNLSVISFLIKKDYLFYGPNDLKFVFPQAVSPAELGLNEDVRKLAVAFHSFVIRFYDEPKIDDDIFN